MWLRKIIRKYKGYRCSMFESRLSKLMEMTRSLPPLHLPMDETIRVIVEHKLRVFHAGQ